MGFHWPHFSTNLHRDLVSKAAKSSAFLRPLIPYPGWRYDIDWSNVHPAFRLRRAIWSYCRSRGWELPVELPWHDGLHLTAYLANDVSRQLFVSGCIEPNEFAFLDKILAPSMVFIDAGANEGLYTLFASRRVGSSGQVWAFEPSRREFERLKRNVSQNRLTNVRLFSYALGECNDDAALLVTEGEHSGQNTLGKPGHKGVDVLRRESVPLRRLDDLARDEKLHQIDVLKLDVEGAEFRLLEGAGELLRHARPLILFEVFEEALRYQGASSELLLQLLSAAGYCFYAFDRGTGLPVPSTQPVICDNMIASPIERPIADHLLGTTGQAGGKK